MPTVPELAAMGRQYAWAIEGTIFHVTTEGHAMLVEIQARNGARWKAYEEARDAERV